MATTDVGYGSSTADAAAAMAAAVAAQATASAALPRAGGNMTGNVTADGGVTFDGADLSLEKSDLDAVQVKTDHLAFVGGALETDVDIAPAVNGTLAIGTGAKRFATSRINSVE